MTESRKRAVLSWATESHLARATVAKGSMEVSEPIRVLSDDRVIVYGERGLAGSEATRTEIELPNGKVIIHRNYHPATTPIGIKAIFNRIDVIPGTGPAASLQITLDPYSSIYDPALVIYDGEEEIGRGYGKIMDITLAGDLLGDWSIGGKGINSHIDPSVSKWILGRLNG